MVRPEGYREDIRTCYQAEDAGTPREEWQRILTDLRAACESGWDFSSRWLRKRQGAWPLWTIRTSSISAYRSQLPPLQHRKPVGRLGGTPSRELGSPLPRSPMANRQSSGRHCSAVISFWKQQPGWFYDVAVEPGGEPVATDVDSLAGVFPLFCELATQHQAEAVAGRIEQSYLKPGGVVTSLEEFESSQQWDYPNGWAPLQWATIAGLVNYGYDDLAREIARRFVDHVRRVYDRTGKMMEKYNVVDLDRPGGGGEYPNQVGFGWTNGVVRACLKFLDEGVFWQEQADFVR